MVTTRHQHTAVKGRALIGLMRWLVKTYETYARPLEYGEIPGSVRSYALKEIGRIKV
jgi:hypothetical protein